MPNVNFKAAMGAPLVPAGGGLPPGISSVRTLLEHIIENALLALDEMDGDADFEPDEDGEASLGWTLSMNLGSAAASDAERELDTSDDEPSFGTGVIYGGIWYDDAEQPDHGEG